MPNRSNKFTTLNQIDSQDFNLDIEPENQLSADVLSVLDEIENLAIDHVTTVTPELEATPANGLSPQSLLLRRTVSDRQNSPEAKELHKANLRNGTKAQAHKKEQRDAYAEMIMRTEDREVREYKPSTPEREVELRQARQKKYRSSLSKLDENKKRQARREKTKLKEQQEAQERIDKATIF